MRSSRSVLLAERSREQEALNVERTLEQSNPFTLTAQFPDSSFLQWLVTTASINAAKHRRQCDVMLQRPTARQI